MILERVVVLSKLTFSVAASKFRSFSTSLAYGVPQVSILGPLWFLLSALSSTHFKHNSYHCYANDIKLYFFLRYLLATYLLYLLRLH